MNYNSFHSNFTYRLKPTIYDKVRKKEKKKEEEGTVKIEIETKTYFVVFLYTFMIPFSLHLYRMIII